MATEPMPAFVVCACGAHGRIVRADGRPVMEVYSQKLARLTLAASVDRGLIEARHCAALQRQIHDSGLPPCNDGIPQALLSAVGDWNSRTRRADDRDPTPCFKEPPP